MPNRKLGSRALAFEERRAALEAAFGPSHPPDSPEGVALSFQWDDVTIPGGCCLVFRPASGRQDWLYVSLGLSLPPDGRRPNAARPEAVPSPYGVEIGMLVREPADWVAPVIRQVMWYVRARRPVGAGDRMPFGFERRADGTLLASIGEVSGAENPVFGNTRALVFWPFPEGPSNFTADGGTFDLLVATSITGAEWEMARHRSSEHLLLLLRLAGVGQRTEPGRGSVTSDPRWADAFHRVHRMTRDEAARELGEIPAG